MNHDVEREKNMITNEEAEKAQGILTCKNVFQTKEKAATIANIGKAFEGLMD